MKLTEPQLIWILYIILSLSRPYISTTLRVKSPLYRFNIVNTVPEEISDLNELKHKQ